MLAGCAALPREDSAVLPRAPAQLDAWDLQARVAVRAGADSGQGALSWERRASGQRFVLRGPLGQTLARLTLDEAGARLEDGRQESRRAANAEELLHEASGWHVPLAQLDWWVRGLPAPGPIAAEERDGDGRLLHLAQSGWDVRFGDHRRFGPYELPGSLVLSITVAAAERIETRLVIDHWSFPP